MKRYVLFLLIHISFLIANGPFDRIIEQFHQLSPDSDNQEYEKFIRQMDGKCSIGRLVGEIFYKDRASEIKKFNIDDCMWNEIRKNAATGIQKKGLLDSFWYMANFELDDRKTIADFCKKFDIKEDTAVIYNPEQEEVFKIGFFPCEFADYGVCGVILGSQFPQWSQKVKQGCIKMALTYIQRHVPIWQYCIQGQLKLKSRANGFNLNAYNNCVAKEMACRASIISENKLDQDAVDFLEKTVGGSFCVGSMSFVYDKSFVNEVGEITKKINKLMRAQDALQQKRQQMENHCKQAVPPYSPCAMKSK